MADNSYNTEVYREQETGKIRVKGATKIEKFESGDGLPEAMTKIEQLIDLLTAAGINPDN